MLSVTQLISQLINIILNTCLISLSALRKATKCAWIMSYTIATGGKAFKRRLANSGKPFTVVNA